MILDLRFIRGIGRVRESRPVRNDDLARHSRHAGQCEVLRRFEIYNPNALDHRTGIASRIRRKHAHRVRALGHFRRADEVGCRAIHRDPVQGPRVRQRRQVVRGDLEVEATARRDLAFRRRAAVQEAEIRRRRVVVDLHHRRLGLRIRIAGHVRDHAFWHRHSDRPVRDRRYFQLVGLLRDHPAFASLLAGLAESRNLAIRNDNRLLQQLRHALARHIDRNLERSVIFIENVRRLARHGDNRALRVVDTRQRRLLALLVERRLVAVACVIPHLVLLDRNGHRFLVDERRHAVVLRIHPELEDLLVLNDLKFVGDSAGLHIDTRDGEVRHLFGEGRHNLHRSRLPVEVSGRRAGKRDRRTDRVDRPAHGIHLRNIPRQVLRVDAHRMCAIGQAGSSKCHARRSANVVRAVQRPVVGLKMVVLRLGREVAARIVRNLTGRRRAGDDGLRRRLGVQRPARRVRLGNVAGLVRRIHARRIRAIRRDRTRQVRDVRCPDVVRHPMIGDQARIRRRGGEAVRHFVRHGPVCRQTGDDGLRRRRRVQRPTPRIRARDIARRILGIHARRIQAVAVDRPREVRDRRFAVVEFPVICDQMLVRRFGCEVVALLVCNRPCRRRAGNHRIRRRHRVYRPAVAVRRRDVAGLVRRVHAHAVRAFPSRLLERRAREVLVIEGPVVDKPRRILRPRRHGERRHVGQRLRLADDLGLRRGNRVNDPRAVRRIAGIARRIHRIDADRVRALNGDTRDFRRRVFRHVNAVCRPIILQRRHVAGRGREREVDAVCNNAILRLAGNRQIGRRGAIERPAHAVRRRDIAGLVDRPDVYRKRAVILFADVAGQGQAIFRSLRPALLPVTCERRQLVLGRDLERIARVSREIAVLRGAGR